MYRKFEDESTVPSRSLQAYLVLVGLAWNRQTITYGALSRDQMGGFGSGGILDRQLGCIMAWCYENGLPPLTVLVVNDGNGLPGEGLITSDIDSFPMSLKEVFDFNWFSVFPPGLDELKAAGERATKGTLRPPSK